MPKFIFLFSLLILLFSFPAHADFYKYIDQEGHVRYTDDFSMVPEDQRVSCREYPEFKNDTPTGSSLKTAQTDLAAVPAETPEDLAESENEPYDFDKAYQKLEEKRKNLELEYERIVKNKQELEKEEKNLAPENYKEFNEKVNAFNKRIIDYNKRKADFEAAASEYQRRAAEGREKSEDQLSSAETETNSPK